MSPNFLWVELSEPSMSESTSSCDVTWPTSSCDVIWLTDIGVLTSLRNKGSPGGAWALQLSSLLPFSPLTMICRMCSLVTGDFEDRLLEYWSCCCCCCCWAFISACAWSTHPLQKSSDMLSVNFCLLFLLGCILVLEKYWKPNKTKLVYDRLNIKRITYWSIHKLVEKQVTR